MGAVWETTLSELPSRKVAFVRTLQYASNHHHLSYMAKTPSKDLYWDYIGIVQGPCYGVAHMVTRGSLTSGGRGYEGERLQRK